jgi:hypothetical protein
MLSLTLTETTRLRFDISGNRAVNILFYYAETFELAESVQHGALLQLHANMRNAERLFPAGEYALFLVPADEPGTRVVTVRPIRTTLVHRVMDFGWGLSDWIQRTFPGWLSMLLHMIAIPFQIIILMITVPLSVFIEWIRR